MTVRRNARPAIRGAATVVGDYGSLAGARMLSVLLSMIVIVLATRALGPTGYGLFVYASVVGTLVFTVGSAWTSSAVLRYGRELIEGGDRLAAVTWERLLVTAPLVAVVIGVVALARIGGALEQITPALLALAFAYGIALVVSDHVVYVAQAAGRMKSSALAVVGRQALVAAALTALVVTGAASPAWVVALNLAAWLLVGAVVAVPLWRVAFWPPVRDAALRRRIVLLSLPLIAFTLSQYAMQIVDLVVIGIYRGTDDVGIYGVAFQAYNVLQNVAAAAVPVLTPLFVSAVAVGRSDVVAAFVSRFVPLASCVAAATVGVLASLVPLAVPTLLGDSFRDATTPLLTLLVATVLLVVANLLAPVIVLHEATKAVGWINVAAAAVNVLGDVVLIGPGGLGIVGAAVATAASALLIVIGYVGVVARRTGAIPSFRPVVALPLTVGIVAAIALPPAFAALVGVPAVIGVTLGALRWGRLVDAAELERLGSLGMPDRLLRAVRRVLP